MKECFGYIRVSTVKQGEGVSLDAQRDAILRFAEQNRLTIIRWFEEKETAAKTGRPVFSAMIKALHARKASGVVMHKIDRSARNFADWAKIGDLADAGIDVHFATESLDFRSRGGRLAADIQAVVAADYIRNLRDETIKGIGGRLNQGLYPFGAPLGYLNHGGGKVKTSDPDRAPLVRQAFELYASGRHSLRSLVEEMTRRGLRNLIGRPLAKSSLEDLLGNPFYCGIIRIKRTGAVYQGVHEPIVSIRIFERVQEIRAGKAGKKVTRHNHTFGGLFRCALCTGPMIPERQKGHVYYRCQSPSCAMKCVREEALDAAIANALSRARLSDDHAAQLAAGIREWLGGRARRDGIAPLRLQMAQVDGRLDRLTDAFVDGSVDPQVYARRKEAALRDRRRIEEAIQDRRNRTADADHIERFLELAKRLVSNYEIATAPEKRQMVEILTSNRQVGLEYVGVEPQNWLLTGLDTVGVRTGCPERPTPRILRLDDDKIEKLISVAREVAPLIAPLLRSKLGDDRHLV